MTTAQKDQLYEKIMQSISKTLTELMNESAALNESFKSSVIRQFIDYCSEYAKKYHTDLEVKILYNSGRFRIFSINRDGEYRNNGILNVGDLTDNNIHKERFFKTDELRNIIKTNKRMYINTLSEFIHQNRLFDKGLSIIFAESNNPLKTIVASIFVNKEGTDQIRKMIDKHKQREKDKNSGLKLTDAQSKIDYQRQMF